MTPIEVLATAHAAAELIASVQRKELGHRDSNTPEGIRRRAEQKAKVERAEAVAAGLFDLLQRERTATTTYLCIGHRAWPDPMQYDSVEKAIDWFAENGDADPDPVIGAIRVDRITTFREEKVMG